MGKTATFALPLFAAMLCAGTARADATPGVTAIIDIDNRPIAIQVDDLPSCIQAIANRINDLKALYQNNFTVGGVIGECFARDGRLLASGRCGARIGSGQSTLLCVPKMDTSPPN